MKKTARAITMYLVLLVGLLGISVVPQSDKFAQDSIVVSAIAPACAEASSYRHSNSLRKQIERDAKKNVKHFFDRLFRTYSDSYINGIRDRENIKRQERNRVLRQIYRDKYSSRYAPSAKQYEADFDYYAREIYSVVDTGEWINIQNVNDRVNFRKVAKELGICAYQHGSKMRFSSTR